VYAGTVVVATGAWLAVAMAQAGAGKVWFALVGFYIAYTQSVFPTSAGGVVAHLAEIAGATVLLIAGAVLSRRVRSVAWVPILWAGASLMVPALSRQPYAHYLTPAAVPLAMLVAMLPIPRRSPGPSRSVVLRLTPQLAGLGIAFVLASVAGLDWIPPASPSPLLNSSRTLGQYYGGAVNAAINKEERRGWNASFDSRVEADEDVAEWLTSQGLTGTTAVVWSSDAWLYALADLDQQVPTPPIYNDEVLFGINGPVADYVAMASPTLIIVAEDAEQQFPEVARLLDGTRYQRVFESAPDTVWVRSDVVASVIPDIGR
jgi:hypothetical protein